MNANSVQKAQVRQLQSEFPGVSSYNTILRLVVIWGEAAARRQLAMWQEQGTTAPRRG